VILDIGCGGKQKIPLPRYISVFRQRLNITNKVNKDGVLNLQIAETLKQGSGKIHGTDLSEAMIKTSKAKASDANLTDICTFEGMYLFVYISFS